MTSAYQYDTIPPGRWFRLLLIEPGQYNDDLHCTLVTTAMDDAPDYIALSYVWGDPANVGYIKCSGFERPVTINLHGGLRQLRHPEKTEAVWADAICINQADNDEKAHQVNMMGTIYDQAAEVFVWLGHDLKSLASHAFECLPVANHAITTGDHRAVIESEGVLVINGKRTPYPLVHSKSRLETLITDHQLEAITQLYQLPWFTRVWVQQEVGLATKATACWGDYRIDFGEIALFVWYAMNQTEVKGRIGPEARAVISGCPYNAVYGVWSTYDKKKSWIQASGPLKIWADHLAAESNVDFLLVLEASRNFSATDARDHVFAFLGHPRALLPTTGEPIVKADYVHDLDHLYRRLTEGLAKTSLNFLVHAQNTRESLKDINQPSWVPRWDLNLDEAPTAFWEAWDASLRISKQYKHPARITGDRIHVSALLLDTVAAQTDIMKSAEMDEKTGRIGYWIEQCWNLTERGPHKYGDEAVLAFATIVRCSYKSDSTDEGSGYNAIGDLCEGCRYYNFEFFEKKLLPFGFTYRMSPLIYLQFANRFQHIGSNRRFFVTSKGYWGMGPAMMQEGDVCSVLIGGDVPFVLRPTEEKGVYRLVGQAYMHGVMYGEVVGSEGLNEEEVCIV